ncbi:MAG TPA: RDD family protein [Steroidobacteraceae bacterium]|nr:RDD family protein [Steroidobacteraceae bacterium]
MNPSIPRCFASLALVVCCVIAAAAPARADTPSPAASVTPVASVTGAAPATPAPAAVVDLHPLRENSLVSIGHDSTLASGRRAESVVSIFGSSTSAGEAGSVVSILGDTRVTGTADDGVVAVLGNTYVDGKVGGDAVAVLGSMQLGPNADVGGDVVVVGGPITRDPAAIVHGSVRNVLVGPLGDFTWLHPWIEHCLLYARPLAVAPGLAWAWGVALIFLALYVCFALLFRPGLMQCVGTLETQPGQSVLAALLAVLLAPVLVVLLCVTVIGIAAVPFVVLGLFCAALFGKAVVLAWLGRACLGRRDTPLLGNPALAVLVGGAIVLALYLVPVLGFVAYKGLDLLGLGVVLYTLLLKLRARHAAVNGGAVAAAGDAIAAAGGAEPVAAGAAANPDIEESAAHAAASAAAAGGASAAQAAQAARPVVDAALPRAGFWLRMAALLVDVLLVGILTGLLAHWGHAELLILAAYGAAMWKLRGSTIGGIVFHLRVVRLDGREIDWATAIARALGCFLSLAVAGLGFIWIAFDGDKQAWHDKIAGTVVVRSPASPSLV